jgi:hypothetical protein
MARYTVSDVEHTLLPVLVLDRVWLVLVTTIAGVRLGAPRIITARVAGQAVHVLCTAPLFGAVIEWKGVAAQARRRPAIGRVTGRTICAKLAAVDSRLSVAGDARLVRTGGSLGRMAGIACRAGVCAIESKDLAVLKVLGQGPTVVAGETA